MTIRTAAVMIMLGLLTTPSYAIDAESHRAAEVSVAESVSLLVDGVLDGSPDTEQRRVEAMGRMAEYAALARTADTGAGEEAALATEQWARETKRAHKVIEMRGFWEAANRALLAQRALGEELSP